MDERWRQKLATLADETTPPVRLDAGIDLTTSPAHPRISVPAPGYTPAFEILDRAKLADTLGVPLASTQPLVSELTDVSSSPDGVCLVTSNVFALTNAHAGTHADQPRHWLAEPPFTAFDDRQYTGDATIVDASPLLTDSPAITPDILNRLLTETGVAPARVRRLIVRTYEKTPAGWDADFAYLAPETARMLGEWPRLVLFGIDTPSVDHHAAAPIVRCSHGGLWTGRVAILEGLNCDAVPRVSRLDGVLRTVWNPMQLFEDARGAIVTFFPR